jgi:hypothetical protein
MNRTKEENPMKALVNILLAASAVGLVGSLVTKFSTITTVAGIGPTGFLFGSMTMLLFGANFALLELLNKK